MALVYTILAAVSAGLAVSRTESAPVWLAGGALYAALLLGEHRTWPAWLAGAFVANTAWGMWRHALDAPAALAFGAIDPATMALGAALATLVPARTALGRAALCVAGVVLGCAVGGLIGAEFWRAVRPGGAFAMEGLTWAAATGLGALLVAPVVAGFSQFRVRRSGGMPMGTFLAGAVVFALFLMVALVVFADGPQLLARFGSVAATLAYLPMPLLLAAALLWGPVGGPLAMLAGSLLMVWRTAHGGGPFLVAEGFGGEAIVEVQVYVALWAVLGIAMRALLADRRAALAEHRAWKLRHERALHAVGVASAEYDVVDGRLQWDAGAAGLLGPLGPDPTLAGWLDRVAPAERGLVQAAWLAVAEGAVPRSRQTYTVRAADGSPRRVSERLAAVVGGDGRIERVAALLALAEPGDA